VYCSHCLWASSNCTRRHMAGTHCGENASTTTTPAIATQRSGCFGRLAGVGAYSSCGLGGGAFIGTAGCTSAETLASEPGVYVVAATTVNFARAFAVLSEVLDSAVASDEVIVTERR
jgi:hypothetical protein